MGKWKKMSLYVMTVFYILAGFNHFANPIFYKKIMPPWLDWHTTLIFISGALEIIFGVLLLPIKTRQLAAWGIIALLIAVFPANVQMMINFRNEQNPYYWVAVLRLPLQLLLIGWAYQFTKNKKIK